MEQSFQRFEKWNQLMTVARAGLVLALGCMTLITAPAFSQSQSSQVQVSQEALDFGHRQVARMIADRPAMACVDTSTGKSINIDRSWFVWKWCAERFAGAATVFRIRWRADEPLGNADHAYSEKEGGFIRLSKLERYGSNRGKPRPFESLWGDAIYEFLNFENGPDTYDNFLSTLAGLVTKQEYMENITRLEHRALIKQMQFYEKRWKPWAVKNCVSTDQRYWHGQVPKKYEDWIAQYRNPKGYPWNPYGKYYEEKLIPYLRDEGRPAPKRSLNVESVVVILKLKNSGHSIVVNKHTFRDTGKALARHLKARVSSIIKESKKPVGVIVDLPTVSRGVRQRVRLALENSGTPRVVVFQNFPDLGH